MPGTILDEIVEDHFDSAKVLVKATASAIRQHCPDSEILEEIIEGFAKEEIIRYAEEQKANLIIVGSHGRSGFQRMILGSVSLAVVSHAPCSVVVVRLPNAAQDDSTHDESRSENKADVAMKS